MENKKQALAEYLGVKPELIKNNYFHYYTVNERIVKRGKTPEEIKQTAEDMRSLFDLGIQGLISSGITSTNEKLRKEIYAEAKEALAPIAEKAKQWKAKRQLNDVRPHTQTSPAEIAKHKMEENYLKLQKDYLYVENVLYGLLIAPDDGYNNGLRKAWVGEPVDDLRKDEMVDDGEYLVLTEEEADEMEEERLRDLFQNMTYEVPDFLREFVDEDKYVEKYSGNRGENLNSYDGSEVEQRLGDEMFYIYRNN